jgi:hypothetical protein
VFDHVSVIRGGQAGGQALRCRLQVGERLLLYVLVRDVTGLSTAELQRVLSAGREERDREAFNRLRLVVPSDDGPVARKSMVGALERMADMDERTHLHFVRLDEIEELCG